MPNWLLNFEEVEPLGRWAGLLGPRRFLRQVGTRYPGLVRLPRVSALTSPTARAGRAAGHPAAITGPEILGPPGVPGLPGAHRLMPQAGGSRSTCLT